VGLVLAMFNICYQGINLFAQLDETNVYGSGIVNSLNHYTHLNNRRTQVFTLQKTLRLHYIYKLVVAVWPKCKSLKTEEETTTAISRIDYVWSKKEQSSVLRNVM
jgi:hypothetical protein